MLGDSFRYDSILVVSTAIYHTLIFGVVQRISYILVFYYNNFVYDQMSGIFYTVALIYCF
jgi:hypothetical protein